MGTHSILYKVLIGLALPVGFQGLTPSTYTDRFRKYWALLHFKREPHEYFFSLDYLILKYSSPYPPPLNVGCFVICR